MEKKERKSIDLIDNDHLSTKEDRENIELTLFPRMFNEKKKQSSSREDNQKVKNLFADTI